MNTLLLAGLAYLALSPKGSSTPAPASSAAPAPKTQPSGSDLAAAFGAFVGGLIASAKD